MYVWGAGMVNSGDAVLRDCSVIGNYGNLSGAGIYNLGSLGLTNCTIASNSVGLGTGAGLMNLSNSILANTTVSGNFMRNFEDESGAGIWNSGTLTLYSSTVCSNQGPVGVYNVGVFKSKSSILAETAWRAALIFTAHSSLRATT